MRQFLNAFWHTTLGNLILTGFVRAAQYRVFSPRTVELINFDVMRLRARRTSHPTRREAPPSSKLHLGCGSRRIEGWHNVDVLDGDQNVDLACGSLPWADHSFEVVVSQHVIEHLELFEELIPLLRELRRVAKPNGELWLTCPDMETTCRSYLENKGRALVEDRLSRRNSGLGMDDVPPQQMVNAVFHQSGQHKNLFDFELLKWALSQGGIDNCERVREQDLLSRFPEFPLRNDDFHSLYVRATI